MISRAFLTSLELLISKLSAVVEPLAEAEFLRRLCIDRFAVFRLARAILLAD